LLLGLRGGYSPPLELESVPEIEPLTSLTVWSSALISASSGSGVAAAAGALLVAAIADVAAETDAEVEGEGAVAVDAGAEAVAPIEIFEPVPPAGATWDATGAPDAAGVPWRPQAVPARPTSPTTRTVAASFAVELFWRFTGSVSFVAMSHVSRSVVTIAIVGGQASGSWGWR
jgi:hypothetical protein